MGACRPDPLETITNYEKSQIPIRGVPTKATKSTESKDPETMNMELLHIAACNVHLSVVEHLVSTAGVDINTPGNSGKTALYWALNQNKTDVVALLRANGAHE